MENRNTATGFTGTKKWLLVLGTLFITIASQAANYGNNLALPFKLAQLQLDNLYSLYATLPGMGMMISLPLVGTLSTKFGQKRVALGGIVLHWIVRLVAVLSGNTVLFTLSWLHMGIASGLYISAAYVIMAVVVTPAERPKFYGYIATASAVGTLIGPVLTGWVIDTVSPTAGLTIFGVFAIVPLVLLGILLPNQKGASKSFDFAGLGLLLTFITCMLLWLNMRGVFFPTVSILGIGLPVLGIAALALMIKVELKVLNPSVPVRMFSKKRFRATFVVNLLMVAYSTSIAAYAVRYVTMLMGGSSTLASTITLPQTIVQAVLGMFVGVIIGRHFKKRFRPMALLALASFMISLLILSTLTPTSSIVLIYVATAIGGIGQALTQSLFTPFFQSELKPEEYAAAQGMYTFSGTGGGTIFGSVCGLCLNLGFSFNQVFLLGAGFLSAALILAVFTFRFTKEELAKG